MDLFLRACGATGPLQLDIEEQGRPGPVRRSFAQPFLVVGRDPRADLVLDHPDVSRRHAYIQAVEGGLYCIDLESRSGTHWSSGPARSGWLTPSQSIRIGPYYIHTPTGPAGFAQGQPDPPSPLGVRPSGDGHLPGVILKFRLGMAEPTLWRMRRVLALVGNSPRCKVQLADPSVSGFHCALLRTPEGLWMVDLLGRGGVWVNGISARWEQLHDGDQIEVGYVSVRVSFEAPPADDHMATPDPDAAPLPVLAPSQAWEPAAAAGWVAPAPSPAGFMGTPIPETSEIPASALALVMNHFSQMHQQMLDQFNQSTMMMFRMLKDASGSSSLRQELNRLDQISQELQALKAELAARPAVPPSRTLTEAPPLPSPGPAKAGKASSGTTRTKEPKTAESAASPASTDSVTPGRDPAPSAAPAAASGAAPPNGASAPAGAESAATSGPEAHDWLFKQIVEFQNEQQTRWQKIRDMVLGK